jgi:hypothetical protein
VGIKERGVYLLVDPLWVRIMEEDERVQVAVEESGSCHDGRVNCIRALWVVPDGKRFVRTVFRVGSESSKHHVRH